MKRSIPLVFAAMMACGGGDGNGPIGPGTVSSDITTMQVGEVRVYAPANIPNGLNLESVTSPREYILVVGNTSNRGDVVASYQVRGNLSAAGSGQPDQRTAFAPQLSPALGGLALSEGPQQRLERRVRGFERSALKLRAPSGPLGLAGLSLRRGTQVAAAVPPPAVGDTISVKIPDASRDSLCDHFFETRAEVVSVSNRAILAVDTLDGPPAALFTQADYDAIAFEFDQTTFPTDSSYFGVPTDIDQNEGHVIILFTGRVNELTPPASGSGFVGGFFFAGDFFPSTGLPEESCRQSNQAEIFYLLAPDPTGLKYGNVRTTAAVRQGTRGTIAHEFVHMINAGRRYVGGVATEFEVAWLDEGLAHLGEEVVGRRVKGFGDLQPLAYGDVFPIGGVNDYNAFFFQNFARLAHWMKAPDTSSGISIGARENLSSRGAAWAVVRYAADNFSNGEPRQYTRRLVAGPDTGVFNFVSVTAASLDTVLAGYFVANYADDLPGIGNISARHQYRSYNLRSIMPPVSASVLSNGGVYPLKVEAIGTGTGTLAGTNRTGSGTYYKLSVPANAGPKNVKVTDASGAVVSFAGAHVYVLRVQ